MSYERSDLSTISRREVLLTGAAMVGSATFARAESNTKPEPKGWIDAHSHVWTPDVERFPLGSWASKDNMKPPSFTAEQLLAITKPSGVTRVVLIQHAPYHGYDNSYIIDCAKRHPGVFSLVAMMDERKPDIPERLKKLAKQGVRGLRIGPTKNADRTLVKDPPNWLKTDGMQALWKAAGEQGIAICPLLGPEFLPTLAPMCKKFSGTTCVIDHFGHASPDTEGSMEKLTALAKLKNVHVKVSGFYKFGDKKAPYDDLAPLIKPVFDAFGPERLMWASDCPYQLLKGNNYPDAVELISKKLDFLSAGDREWILRKTAERVFFA